MDITEQIAELRAKLEELERQTQEERQAQEEPKPLLTGPCIAKTRDGFIAVAVRGLSPGWPFIHKDARGMNYAVYENGNIYTDSPSDCDIVEVIRPLTEQEVLDWQFRGIEPELSVASESGYQIPEGFKSCELGRKEAQQMGLIHLGRATSDGMHEVDGTLYFFDFWNNEWKPKPGDYRVYEDDTYAYMPADSSVFSDVVAEGFEHSDEGRKRAKELGLVYLGKATERQDMSLPGELYIFELEVWRKRAAIDRTVYKGSIYAYKPSGE